MSNCSKVLLGTSSFGKKNPAPIELMERNGLTVVPNPYGKKLTRKQLLELLPGVDCLIAGLETVDRAVLDASDMKVISRCGSGSSNVDVKACEERGIIFKSTPYGPTQAVAELTLAMMINLLREVRTMNQSLNKGIWDKHVGFQLKGKTVCIIGFGKIGRRTASLLGPFEVNLFVVDPFLSGEVEGAAVMSMEEALPLADIVVLHASGKDCLLGKNELSLLKDGAFILNPARGENVDESSLLSALDSGKVAGAWLDCFCEEPYAGPLCGHPRVLLTPHIGSYTMEGRLSMEMEAAQNAIDGLCESGLLTGLGRGDQWT
jgi:D-3-phosphoglycerate dehydrogenase